MDQEKTWIKIERHGSRYNSDAFQIYAFTSFSFGVD